MKIEINEYGNLLLERAGKMKEVYCPYALGIDGDVNGWDTHCGDWCALFGELKYINIATSGKGETITGYELPLCKKSIVVFKDSFTDKRKTND